MKRAAKLLTAAVRSGDVEAAHVARIVLHSRDTGATDSTISIALCYALRFGEGNSEENEKRKDDDDENIDKDEEYKTSDDENHIKVSRHGESKSLIESSSESSSHEKTLIEWKSLAGRILRRYITAACPGWIKSQNFEQLTVSCLSALHFAQREDFIHYVLLKKEE